MNILVQYYDLIMRETMCRAFFVCLYMSWGRCQYGTAGSGYGLWWSGRDLFLGALFMQVSGDSGCFYPKVFCRFQCMVSYGNIVW